MENQAVDDPVTSLPSAFTLSAYPNPFNGEVTIHYELSQSAGIEVAIYNVLGEQVEVLGNGRMEAGQHAVKWQAKGPSGIYFVRMSGADMQTTQKIMLLK
jgi:hypothetical protein